jgi:hypothetical protein
MAPLTDVIGVGNLGSKFQAVESKHLSVGALSVMQFGPIRCKTRAATPASHQFYSNSGTNVELRTL